MSIQEAEISCPRCGERPANILILEGPLISNLKPEDNHFVAPCDICEQTAERDWQQFNQDQQYQLRLSNFRDTIPPIYRENDVRRFPDVWKVIQNWTPKEKRGLLLIGESGHCKTRMACEIARHNILDRGHGVRFVRASQFAATIRDQFGDQSHKAQRLLRAWNKAQILILDDIGKQNNSELVQEALFDLIEERTAFRRPIIATANANGSEIEAMMSHDRGPALVRRLREFCDAHRI